MVRRGTEHEESVVAGLAATVAGEGPPLVLLHGIGSSRAAFHDQIAHFSELGYQCVAPDAPGYGDSPEDAEISTMDDYAARYEALIDELGGGTCALVGVSFGGVIATRVAVRGSAPVSALVLVDSSRGAGVDAASAARMRARPAALVDLGAQTFAERRTPELLGSAASPDLAASVAATMASAVRPEGFRIAAEAMAATDHTDALGVIECPTLVVVGAEDAVCPPEESLAIAAAIRGATFVEIPGAGHLTNQEQPGLFNSALESFLATHLPPAAGESGPRR